MEKYAPVGRLGGILANDIWRKYVKRTMWQKSEERGKVRGKLKFKGKIYAIRQHKYLAHFDPIRRNWFCTSKSWLTTMVAIGH